MEPPVAVWGRTFPGRPVPATQGRREGTPPRPQAGVKGQMDGPEQSAPNCAVQNQNACPFDINTTRRNTARPNVLKNTEFKHNLVYSIYRMTSRSYVTKATNHVFVTASFL